MSRVEELTKELTEAITDSCEYKRFKEFESEVMKRPDLKRALDDFRRENFRMQYSEDTGDVLSATQELEGHFADIRKQPEMSRPWRVHSRQPLKLEEVHICRDWAVYLSTFYFA